MIWLRLPFGSKPWMRFCELKTQAKVKSSIVSASECGTGQGQPLWGSAGSERARGEGKGFA